MTKVHVKVAVKNPAEVGLTGDGFVAVTVFPSNFIVTSELGSKSSTCNIYRNTNRSRVGIKDNDRVVEDVTVNVFEAELDP